MPSTQRIVRLLARPLFTVALLVRHSLPPPGRLPRSSLIVFWTSGSWRRFGGWDYLIVDSPAHRLYLTRSAKRRRPRHRDRQAGGQHRWPEWHARRGLRQYAGNFGYISDGRANAVVVFDRVTLATVDTIPAGTNPDGIIFEPATQTVWAFNGRSKRRHRH
jgi:YVTN family beta-propeller protein